MARAFYYDIVCPYAYMAFHVLKSQNAFQKNNLDLKPILLGGLFKHLQSDNDPNKTMPAVKADYVRKDIARQAKFFSVPLKFHPRHPVSTVAAMRLLHACTPLRREQLTDVLYQAYWVHNLDIDDDAVIKKMAYEFSIGAQETYYENAKLNLMAATEDAFSAKVFGVPTVILNEQRYFGADRLPLIAKELGLTLKDPPWTASSLPVDFYFDFSSPYSYLGFAEVKRALQAGVTVNFKPILLGAIFKELHVHNIPMLSAHPHKTAYYLQDMTMWAKHRDVLFSFSPHFPIRSVLPLRVALLDSRVIDPIFSAAWAYKKDVGDPRVLQEVLHEAGFDAPALLQKADEESIKNALKAMTAEAVSRGVFGVPTFFVGEEKIFGQDRFPWIKHELSRH